MGNKVFILQYVLKGKNSIAVNIEGFYKSEHSAERAMELREGLTEHADRVYFITEEELRD